jgi:hypothetical protein
LSTPSVSNVASAFKWKCTARVREKKEDEGTYTGDRREVLGSRGRGGVARARDVDVHAAQVGLDAVEGGGDVQAELLDAEDVLAREARRDGEGEAVLVWRGLKARLAEEGPSCFQLFTLSCGTWSRLGAKTTSGWIGLYALMLGHASS